MDLQSSLASVIEDQQAVSALRVNATCGDYSRKQWIIASAERKEEDLEMKIKGMAQGENVELGFQSIPHSVNINITDHSDKSAWVSFTTDAAREIAAELNRLADEVDKADPTKSPMFQ